MCSCDFRVEGPGGESSGSGRGPRKGDVRGRIEGRSEDRLLVSVPAYETQIECRQTPVNNLTQVTVSLCASSLITSVVQKCDDRE